MFGISFVRVTVMALTRPHQRNCRWWRSLGSPATYPDMTKLTPRQVLGLGGLNSRWSAAMLMFWSAWEERCRWWVAVTRARHLVRVLVSDGVSVPYLP